MLEPNFVKICTFVSEVEHEGRDRQAVCTIPLLCVLCAVNVNKGRKSVLQSCKFLYCLWHCG
jgi:hypothetical protein